MMAPHLLRNFYAKLLFLFYLFKNFTQQILRLRTDIILEHALRHAINLMVAQDIIGLPMILVEEGKSDHSKQKTLSNMYYFM